jgi:transposase
MSPAYTSAVQENLPEAAIVYDHFHVIKLYNEKLTDLRHQIVKQAAEAEKPVLKGTRWLLLKNPENLDDRRDEANRLREALEINRPLAAAYYLKEDLRRLWSCRNKKQALQFIKDWIYRASSAGVEMLFRFAMTWPNTTKASWPTTIILYRPDRWRVPTTRSKP